MASRSTAATTPTLLPAGLTAFLRRRLIEFSGVALMMCAGFLALGSLRFKIGDPGGQPGVPCRRLIGEGCEALSDPVGVLTALCSRGAATIASLSIGIGDQDDLVADIGVDAAIDIDVLLVEVTVG